MLTMTHDLASLLALPAAERWRAYQEGEHLDDATLQAIWDSLRAEGFELPLSDDEARELDRRIAEHLANPGSAIPFDEAMRRIRAALR
jgi:putative addiction module component (TIGR02574 family)